MAAEQDVWSRSMKHGLRLNAAIVARTLLLTMPSSSQYTGIL